MENPDNLSPEELAERKEEMLRFYEESMPYLNSQLKYEKMLCEIDELRFKRSQIQMQYAMMMAPPEEKEDSDLTKESTPETSVSKKRKLKTNA